MSGINPFTISDSLRLLGRGKRAVGNPLQQSSIVVKNFSDGGDSEVKMMSRNWGKTHPSNNYHSDPKMAAINPFTISDSLRLLTKRKQETGNIYPSQKSSVVVKNVKHGFKMENDRWEVKALPPDWEAKTGPSERLEKYLKNKELQHEEILKTMRIKMQEVTYGVEEEIRAASSVLKKHLADGEKDIEELMVPLLPDRYKDFVIIERKLVDASMKVQQVCDEALYHIGRFNDILQCVERKRSDVFKCILRKSYESLQEVAHRLPHDLQEFFELEISNINQITLSNHKSYAELKMELALRVENSRRLWLQRLDALRSAHKAKKVSDMGFSLSPPEVEHLSGVFRAKAGSLQIENLLQHATDITTRLFTFDNDLEVVKNTIRELIETIVEQRYDEVQNVQLQFVNCDFSDSQFSEVRNEVINTFFVDPESKDLSKYSDDMLVKWERLMSLVSFEYSRAVRCLEKVQHLWDRHFERDYNLKAASYANIDAMEQEYALQDQNQFCGINLVMDRMRQASTEQELKGLMVEAKQIIDNAKKTMDEHHASKLTALKKFETLAGDEGEILREEIDCFVELSDKYPDIDPTIQHVRLSRMQLVQQESKTAIMLLVENQVKALHNWMYGLTETITSQCLTKQQRYILKNAENFVSLQRKKLDRRLTLKSKLLSPKMQRIFGAIYQVRLAELVRHGEIFQQHLQCVEAEMDRIKTAFSKDAPAWTNILQKFSDETMKLIAKVPLTKSSLNATGLVNQLECVKQAHLKELYIAKEEYQKKVDDGVVEVARLNLQYLKCIRLFNEGGNYSHGELPEYVKTIMGLNKSLTKRSDSIKKDIYETWSSMCYRIGDECLQFQETLQQNVEEHEFYEATVRHLQKLQATIKNSTHDLRKRYKLAETYFVQLRRFSSSHVGDSAYLDEFAENCALVQTAFEGARNLLLQEVPFKLNPKVLDNLGALDVAVAESETKDYSRVLFERPTKSKDYMAEIVGALHESLDTIQAKAEEFYAMHNVFSHVKIATTFEEFMLEILAKHLFYQLQCEEAWLEISRDYIMLTDKVLDFVRYFYTQCTNKYLETKSVEFGAICANFRRRFDVRRRQIEDGYAELHGKLKPLHGHPGNFGLLEELEGRLRELDEGVVRTQDEMDSNYDGIKDEIYRNVYDFEAIILDMEKKLQATLGEYVRHAVRDEALATQLGERIGYMRTLIDNDYVKANRSSDNLLLGLNRRLNTLKCELRLKSDDLKLMSDSLQQTKMSLCSYSDKSSSMNHLHIDDLIQVYKDKQMKCCAELGGRRNFLAISNRWNEIWRNDVERIRGLYTVKYPCAQ